MLSRIRVAILDDHQSIIDGFTYRLSMDPAIQIVSTALFGEDLEAMVANNPVDVLLLDVSVPNSQRGDVDGDNDVDTDDLAIIQSRLNTSAVSAGDACDLNRDGRIDALDTRILATLCTRARCATR